MEGHVFKLSDWRKNWNKRYFELVHPESEGGAFVLRYRHRPGSDVMPSYIEMDAEAVRVSDVNEEHETLNGGKQLYRWSVVSVKLSGLRFDLASPSLKLSRQWVQKLRRCMRVGEDEVEEEEEEESEEKEYEKKPKGEGFGSREVKDMQHGNAMKIETSKEERGERPSNAVEEKDDLLKEGTKVRSAFAGKRHSVAQALRQKRIPPTIREEVGRGSSSSSPEQKSHFRNRKHTPQRRSRTESYSVGIKSAPKFGRSFFVLRMGLCPFPQCHLTNAGPESDHGSLRRSNSVDSKPSSSIEAESLLSSSVGSQMSSPRMKQRKPEKRKSMVMAMLDYLAPSYMGADGHG